MFNLLQVTTLLLYFHRVGISFAYNKSTKQVNQILIDIYSIIQILLCMVVLKDYAFVKVFLELILNISLLTAMLKCSYLINLSVCHNNIM